MFGWQSPDKTNRRLDSLDSSETLTVNDASKKNNFYVRVTEVGSKDRTFNSAPQQAWILKSQGFVEDIARSLGEDAAALQDCIPAMRVDMILSQNVSNNSELNERFRTVVEKFLEAKLRVPPSIRAEPIVVLNEEWDHRTMESFYRNLYAGSNRRIIGSWTPYEIEVLDLFYRQQIASGNLLIPFDRAVLNIHKKGLVIGNVVNKLRVTTGIEIRRGALWRHRGLLSYGSFQHVQVPVPIT